MKITVRQLRKLIREELGRPQRIQKATVICDWDEISVYVDEGFKHLDNREFRALSAARERIIEEFGQDVYDDLEANDPDQLFEAEKAIAYDFIERVLDQNKVTHVHDPENSGDSPIPIDVWKKNNRKFAKETMTSATGKCRQILHRFKVGI